MPAAKWVTPTVISVASNGTGIIYSVKGFERIIKGNTREVRLLLRIAICNVEVGKERSFGCTRDLLCIEKDVIKNRKIRKVSCVRSVKMIPMANFRARSISSATSSNSILSGFLLLRIFIFTKR